MRISSDAFSDVSIPKRYSGSLKPIIAAAGRKKLGVSIPKRYSGSLKQEGFLADALLKFVSIPKRYSGSLKLVHWQVNSGKYRFQSLKGILAH